MLIKGIKQKLVLSLVIMTLVIMTVFIFLLDSYIKSYSLKDTEQIISVLGKNTASTLGKPLFNADYTQLKTIVQSIFLSDFGYLVVFDNITRNIAFIEDKNNLTQFLRFETLLNGKIKPTIEKLNLKESKYTQYIFPIVAPGVRTPLGFLVIGVSDAVMKSKLTSITNRIFAIGFLLFITLFITIYLLADRITRPINELSNKISKFASGDYSVRSHIHTNDEILTLSNNFNFMADKINEQIISIEQYSKNLERMVEERTEELLRALDAIREKDTKLTRAEKLNSLNSIVSSIAHEINNPLAIISGNIQLIECRVEDASIQKKINTANDAVKRIANLISEINFFASIKDASVAPLMFHKILTEITEKVIPPRIICEIDPGDDDNINSNDYLISVTLENVIKNSIEMISHRQVEDGKITIRYYTDFPYFVIEIIDNAGGFDEAKRAFDPFYSTFENKKGLGLTFAYHAIDALNGEIKIENTQDGSIVTIMLPTEIPKSQERIWLP